MAILEEILYAPFSDTLVYKHLRGPVNGNIPSLMWRIHRNSPWFSIVSLLNWLNPTSDFMGTSIVWGIYNISST